MTDFSDDRFHGDRPIDGPVDDRLGFQLTADRLAKTIARQTPRQGLVVGIEGIWGSGKSSLLNLTLRSLEGMGDGHRPAVVRFQPWLIGDRDALLTALFADLARAIEDLDPPKGARGFARKADKLAETIRTFGAGLSGLGKATRLASLFIPGAGFAADVVDAIVDASNSLSTATSLADQKDTIAASLSQIGRHVIIAIDDIDRLDPGEALEVLRLIRSVADFPSITYLLCYDDRVLSRSIEKAARVPDGRAFLEKIIQIVVPVPIPEAFDLRNWFRRDLEGFATVSNNEQQQHLEYAIDVEGARRLTTPRVVVRALNSLRFSWPALQNEVDLGDLVWLHLVRASNLRLYRWIEDYCGNWAFTQSGLATVSEEEKSRSLISLEKLLKADRTNYAEAQHSLAEYLPGLSYVLGDDKPKLFESGTKEQLQRLIDGRRLGSPDHYRLYFALSAPANAPKQAEFAAFWAAANQSKEAVETIIARWINTPYSVQSSLAELMLDRLQSDQSASLSSTAAKRIMLALADVADLGSADHGPWGRPGIWGEAKKLLGRLLPLVGDRASTVQAMFRRGSSLGWLTQMLRDQMFAHGMVAGQSARGGALLEIEEVVTARREMLARYKALSINQLLNLPQPLNTMFAWYQAGDENGPRALLANSTQEDTSFLSVLEQLSTVSHTSDGDRRVLSRDNLRYFLDYEETKSRVGRIASSRASKNRERAKRILLSFDDGMST